jgi:hypothetical protein
LHTGHVYANNLLSKAEIDEAARRVVAVVARLRAVE